MPENLPKKIVIVATHGIEAPERATIPFVMANAALAMDSKVAVVLQSDGVAIATKGIQEHILAPGFDPLKKLVDSFFEFGGTLLVCIPCIEARKIPPDALIPGAQPVKAGRVVSEMLEASAVVTY
ncbi:MAG TPA: DsrE family protein [Thermoplasmata archaeon]|nr:DsrE family protein [Thermoplasmata archaeon]